MGSVSAYIKQAGYRARLIFMDPQEEALPPDIRDQLAPLVADSDIVGISSMTRSSDQAKQLLAHLRSMGKRIKKFYGDPMAVYYLRSRRQ